MITHPLEESQFSDLPLREKLKNLTINFSRLLGSKFNKLGNWNSCSLVIAGMYWNA